MTQDQQEVISTAIDYPEHLTDWEFNWVETVGMREGDFGSSPELSPKELVILGRIEDKLVEANML